MTNVQTSIDERGRHRAYEFATEIPLGLLVEIPNGGGYWSTFLSGRDDALSGPFATVKAGRLELGRWADRHPEEMAGLHRALIAARLRATSPEPLDDEPAAPVLQGAML